MTPPRNEIAKANNQPLNTPHMIAIAQSYGLSDPAALDALCAASSIRHYSKGQRLLSQGDQQSTIDFVLSGVVRSFYTDVDGNEITTCLIDRMGTPTAPSVDLDSPSIETVEALTDVEVTPVKIDAFKALVAADPSIARAYRRIIEEAWRRQHTLNMVLRQKNASERYLWFLGEYPGLIDRVSHRHIASFLAMTPETLARVRKSLAG